jgi:hypothetical protein
MALHKSLRTDLLKFANIKRAAGRKAAAVAEPRHDEEERTPDLLDDMAAMGIKLDE